MARLRNEEERRAYERMTEPSPPSETFAQRYPGAKTFGSSLPQVRTTTEDEDEVTYAEVNRQVTLIINVLVSIICCSAAIWIAARHWSIPQRLGLSMTGSGVVAVAEVAIYFGYIRRVKEAKTDEAKRKEMKEVVETWVIDGKKKTGTDASVADSLRFRKGKHR